MVKNIPLRWFVLLMLLYFVCRAMRSTFINLPSFFKNHFTDLLFVPTMCLFSLIILRFLKNDPSITIPWYGVVMQTVLISYYFEIHLPSQPGNPYVADFFDVIFYFLGAIFYIILQRYHFRFFKNAFKNNIPAS